MISKINCATPVLTKIAKNPKSAVVAATAGTLAVLATGQAWPHCNGLGTPHNNVAEHPEDYELRWVNGIKTYVRKDVSTDICPKVEEDMPTVDINAAQNDFDMPSAMDFIKHPIDSSAEVIAHAVDKTQTAFDNVRDFFESLGH